ncbi:formylglycine-generating enzyme family protein [Saccharospirillum salsuginis]|uniref:Sulfatase-modifying factor enzyme-like domain-containing protein n=1 Tax=Saccharospirillum salsuginis TaxID=418750 RepID=A0A918KG97_9GAMM|nr:SUMF1/EgtB/PvdO family nonheme iron enzyme [Saccharospirillum salsuginis]GGX62431.1 hypothetical protein GCM10007392_32910 [Saccharospirillum salsuginis]
MNHRSTALTLALSTLALTACRSEPKDDTPPMPERNVTQAEIEELIERSKAQMVFVEGGTFMMGDYQDEDGLYLTPDRDNKPPTEVTLDSYSIGAYEISYGEFDLYTDLNDLPRTYWRKWSEGEEWRGPEFPAGVSWNGAKDYCLWLAEQSGLPFDLPTEAQWEYAARSRGKQVLYATNDGTIREGENYSEFTRYPRPSGIFPPNPLGLYDMAGNMAEWVNDWYAKDYYQRGNKINPTGPETGSHKILRGGVYLESPYASNVFIRQELDELTADFKSTGFRCAVNQPTSIH